MTLKMPEDYAISNHPFVTGPQCGPQWQEMTVSQIETLAKAGVKVELQCPVRVIADPLPEIMSAVHQFGSPDYLLDLVQKRWDMAMRAKHGGLDYAPVIMPNPLIAACKEGDTVYVFVRGGQGVTPHVIEDPVNIFPSDALLARLHLLMEFGK